MNVVVLTAAVDYVAEYESPTYFIPQPNNLTYRARSTAILTCTVKNLGKKFIVWRKTAEPHPISVGNMMYAPDTRYEVAFAPDRREFNLVIRAVSQNDAGVYECQVSSRDKLVRHVLLRIEVVLLTAAVDYVADYDGPTYFIPQPNNVTYQAGATATLTCSVENLGKKFIVWRKTAEPHPISVGNMIYAPDTRYEVAFAPERREFNLGIRAVTQNDAGVYECQVSSRDKLVRHIMLRIEGMDYASV
ncbi:hemicentin-1-like [Dreissena polymorpha]|nr:hemicentin-1-like [Dreissena polymorpha]